MPAASFDASANTYDTDFTHTPIGLLQRKVVLKRFLPLLHPSRKVLEINCGTGYDARLLAPNVKEYFATDVSENMISLCRNYPETQKQNNLRFEKLSIQELDQDLSKFNVLFSNFGGLNCLSPEEFKAFAKQCSDKMQTGSDLYLVIMGRFCVWEQIYFCLKGNFRKAFRRLRQQGTATLIETSGFTTWYYSPRETKKLFAPAFQFIRKGPVALFVPPSYLGPFFKKHPRLLNLLAGVDQVFTNFNFLANFGDHYFLHLKKRT